MENGGGGALPAPMLVPTSRLIRSLSVRLPLLDFHNSSFDDCGSFVRCPDIPNHPKGRHWEKGDIGFGFLDFNKFLVSV